MEYMNSNPGVPYTQQGEHRQLKIHGCFPQCKTSADCYMGFNVDKRESCDIGKQHVAGGPEGILCVSENTECETLVTEDEICLNDDNTLCISWRSIWLSVLLLNCLQLVFEASMAYALEISLRPTNLDRLENDIDDAEDRSNPDKAQELNCQIVLNKCWGELAFVLLYIAIIFVCCMGVVY